MSTESHAETHPSSKDQRRHARLDIALAVNYAIQQSGGEASEMAETLSSDISASGLRLMTVAPLENGSLLNLEITLPEDWPTAGDPIRAHGEVVWQNKISDFSYETGTVIKHMDEADKKRLMSFVFDQMSRLVGAFGGSAGGDPTGGTNPTLLN
jgi:c-di-GMP-binding flagellar brake protein YcgR